jgi:hypothetical protein
VKWVLHHCLPAIMAAGRIVNIRVGIVTVWTVPHIRLFGIAQYTNAM